MQKQVAWKKSEEAAVEKLFHKKAANRLKDMHRLVRQQNKRPGWMGQQVYDLLKDYWKTPEFLALSAQNKKNRASEKGGNLHTGGCISMLQHAKRLAKKLGRNPHVDELHRHTHIRKSTGDFVEERARTTQEEFHRMLSQSNIPVDPAELDKLKRLLWEDAVGGYKKNRLYGTGGLFGNKFDSEASTSESLSPEALRIIQGLTTQFAQQQEQFARQQRLIEYVFSHSGIPVPPPDWQPPQQDQPTQHDQMEIQMTETVEIMGTVIDDG